MCVNSVKYMLIYSCGKSSGLIYFILLMKYFVGIENEIKVDCMNCAQTLTMLGYAFSF